MSYMDLDSNQEANLRERASLNPLDVGAGAGIFDGALTAPVKGLMKGLVAEPARALNLALSAVPRAIDTVRGGTEAQDWWFEKTVSDNSSVGAFSKAVTPDAHTTGVVGQVLHSFFDIGGQALTIGPAGTAILKSTSKSIELVDKGVDATTARKAGAAEGALLGVGVHLPMSIGLKSLGNAFYGGVSSAIPSAAGRGAVHTILAENGYPEMAAQYQWLDRQQVAIDFVLGIALGGLGTMIEAKTMKGLQQEVRASDVDTALTAHNAKHLEIDTAPGLARTPAARDAHVAAVTKATDDLIAGRPIDISETRVVEADFQPNTRIDEVAVEKQAVLKPYDDVAVAVREAANEEARVQELPGKVEQAKAAKAVKPAPAEKPGEAKVEEEPEVRQVQEMAAAQPEMSVVQADGTLAKVTDILKTVDESVAVAKAEARKFDAAVNCFLAG